MNSQTRRTFLALAGTGAAAVGLGSVAPEAQAATVRAPAGSAGPLVAYVSDLQRDEVTLFLGEREILVHDADLTARLARAAHARRDARPS